MIQRHIMVSRVQFEPSWTTVCIGISTAGGNTVARIASSTSPPAAPSATPQNVVNIEAAISPANIQALTSGTPRKCGSIGLDTADPPAGRAMAGGKAGGRKLRTIRCRTECGKDWAADCPPPGRQ